MNRRAAATAVALVLAFGALGAVDVACTPAQRAELAPLVAPGERASCVLLRAFTTSGTVDTVCATADDLAPYVADLLAAKAEEPPPAVEPVVAFAAAAPRRRVSRRRCAWWLPVGPRDAGASLDGGRDE